MTNTINFTQGFLLFKTDVKTEQAIFLSNPVFFVFSFSALTGVRCLPTQLSFFACNVLFLIQFSPNLMNFPKT